MLGLQLPLKIDPTKKCDRCGLHYKKEFDASRSDMPQGSEKYAALKYNGVKR